MFRRRQTIILALSVAALGVVVWQVGIGGSAVHRAAQLSDKGTPVTEESLPTWQQRLLGHAGISAELRIQHQAPDGVAFYTFKNTAGALCFSAAGSAVCPSHGRSFFADAPVEDVMRTRLSIGGDGRPVQGPLLAWRGIALDGVSEVHVIDSAGKQYSAPVVDNTFELQGPIGDPTTFEALDSNAKVIWSRQMAWPK